MCFPSLFGKPLSRFIGKVAIGTGTIVASSIIGNDIYRFFNPMMDKLTTSQKTASESTEIGSISTPK